MLHIIQCNENKNINTKFVLYKMYTLHLLMQMWHTGDYCTINTSLFPCYYYHLIVTELQL